MIMTMTANTLVVDAWTSISSDQDVRLKWTEDVQSQSHYYLLEFMDLILQEGGAFEKERRTDGHEYSFPFIGYPSMGQRRGNRYLCR